MMDDRALKQNDSADLSGCRKQVVAGGSHSRGSVCEHSLPGSFISFIAGELKTYEPLLRAIQMCTAPEAWGCDITFRTFLEKGCMTTIVQPCASMQTSFDNVNAMRREDGILYSVHGWCTFIKGRSPCQWWMFRYLSDIDQRDRPKRETKKAIMEYATDRLDAEKSVENYVDQCSQDFLGLMSPRQVVLLCQLTEAAGGGGRPQLLVENVPLEEIAAELSEQEHREIALERPMYHGDFFNVYMVVPSTPPHFVLQNALAFLTETVAAGVTLRRTALNLVKSRGFADVVLHLVVDFSEDPLGLDSGESKLQTLEETMRVLNANLDPFAAQEEKSPRSLSFSKSPCKPFQEDLHNYGDIRHKWIDEEGRASRPMSRSGSRSQTSTPPRDRSRNGSTSVGSTSVSTLSSRDTPPLTPVNGGRAPLLLPFQPAIEPQLAPVVCAGYLFKSSLSLFKGWRKRWVVIKDKKLVYTKSMDNEVEVFKALNLTDCVLRPHTSKMKPFAFALELPSKRTHLWGADDATTFDSFWSAIRAIKAGAA
jgi:hypothetical protein